MSKKNTFDILTLLARPAAGKSEVIHYLKNTPLEQRAERFHIGKMVEIDDFPMLYTWFEEDDLLERMGYPHLHTDDDGYFLGNHLWNLLIERIGLEYRKKLRDIAGFNEEYSAIVEFSRGTEHGGYASALAHLPVQMVEKMAVLYLDVSWEESLRKNRKRFNPNRPDSILEHSLPDAKLEKLYRENDWKEVSAADPEYLPIQGKQVPYVVFENEDDVTTGQGEALGKRLQDKLSTLWGIYRRPVNQGDMTRIDQGIEAGRETHSHARGRSAPLDGG
jgi:hypothetical protein